MTGRVLSIRDHAVHAGQPCKQSCDDLQNTEGADATTFLNHNVVPFRLLIRLRQISGRILESVYIARAADGSIYDTSFQQIYVMSEDIRNQLLFWKADFITAGLGPSTESSILNIEYCNLQLLLNRPNPTFMLPSRGMLDICSEAVSEATREWSDIVFKHGIASVCRGFRQFHSLLLLGLAGLYHDW